MGVLVPTSRAAEMLGVDPSTLRRQRLSGRIQAVVLGPRAIMYDVDELERYRAEQRGRPGRPKKEAAS